MELLPGYSIKEELFQDKASITFRCVNKESFNNFKIVKVWKTAHLSVSEKAILKNEFSLLINLQHKNIVKHIDVIEKEDNIFQIFEEPKGLNLIEYLEGSSMGIEDFLDMAVELVEGVVYIHSKNLIHLNIQPKTVYYNVEKNSIKLSSFGATLYSYSLNKNLKYSKEIFNSYLSYMSPEQTGRLNLKIDQKSDLYSLGVLFYEILTSRLPFISDDPAEIIYAHFALKPKNPINLNSTIPVLISEIIMKLLEKNPDERYLSSKGLLIDLIKCRNMIKNTGEINYFKLGQFDYEGKLNLDNIFLGRKKEFKQLDEIYKKSTKGSFEVVFVKGVIGSGKSSIIREISKNVSGNGSFFIEGKYDQLRKDVPYSAILVSFKKIIKKLLSQGDDKILEWRNLFLESLDENIQIMINFVPEFEYIVGKHQVIQEVDDEKAENRFTQVVIQFLKVIATSQHSLVLHLDNLQWADDSSLILLQKFITENLFNHFMIILSYRTENLFSYPHFKKFINDHKNFVETVILTEFSLKEVQEFLEDILKKWDGDIGELAKIFFSKTQGNFFKIIQFVKTLYEKKILLFSKDRGWNWNIEKIIASAKSKNIIYGMTEFIETLSLSSLKICQIASCFGNRFSIEDLSVISEIDIDEIVYETKVIIDKGFLVVISGIHYFINDTVQEFFYESIELDDKKNYHLKIAEYLLSKVNKNQKEEKIFYIVSHFNRAVSKDENKKYSLKVLELNYEAALRSKITSAHASVVNYLTEAINLIDENLWDSNYSLFFEIYFLMAESEYIIGNFEKAIFYFNYCSQKAKTRIDKVRVLNKKIVYYTNIGEYEKAFDFGIHALKKFNIRIPKKISKLRIFIKTMTIRYRFNKKDKKLLILSKKISNKEIDLMMNLLMDIGTPAYFFNKKGMIYIILKLIEISFRYGNSKVSAFAYISYAFLLGFGFNLFREANVIGKFAINLNEKIKNYNIKSRMFFIYGYFISHWTDDLSKSLEYLRKAYDSGMQTGDLNYAAYSLSNIILLRYLKGDNLNEILEEIENVDILLKKTKNDEFFYELIATKQSILNLTAKTDRFGFFDSSEFSSSKFEKKIENSLITIHSYGLSRIQSLFLAGMYNEAYAIASKISKTIEEQLFAQTSITDFYFYYSLILAYVDLDNRELSKRKRVNLIKANLKKLKKWALFSSQNYLHKYLLVRAEYYRLNNNILKTMNFYEDAINKARFNGFNNHLAIACELAGFFYDKIEKHDFAKLYINYASRYYSKWGAIGKVKLLNKTYPHYFLYDKTEKKIENELCDFNYFDYESAMNLSITISREIVLDKLLEKLVAILIKSAGATEGVLVMEKDGRFFVEAGKEYPVQNVFVKRIDFENYDKLSKSIVNYVIKIKESVVLNDKKDFESFIDDSYLKENDIKSVICLPISNQGKLIAIFYAENRFLNNAFTKERQKFLQMLSTFIGISLDKSNLYSVLESKILKRTQEVEKAYKTLRDAYSLIQKDMELAQKIQYNLLPSNLEIFEPYKIVVKFLPMIEVGGDIYDVCKLEDGKLRIFIADATGHGIQAAFVTMLIKSEYEKIKFNNYGPATLLTILNDEFLEQYKSLTVFFTCFIVDISIENQNMKYSSAGHPDQFLIDERGVTPLSRTGKIVSFVEGVTYLEKTEVFSQSSKLLLFSDGIYEEFNQNKEEYGTERLKKLIEINSKSSIPVLLKRVVKDVVDFTGKNRVNEFDDVTLIGVSVKNEENN